MSGPSDLVKQPGVQLLAAVLVLSTGGVGSHSLMSSKLDQQSGLVSSKLDQQGEKIDGLKTSLVKVEAKFDAGEKAISELVTQQAALIVRVGSLETRDATRSEQIGELQRRIRDLETRTK